MNDINSIDLLLALRARAELERREIEDMLATRTLRDLDSRGMPVTNAPADRLAGERKYGSDTEKL
ncbi:MAG: hypothetical protein L6455_13185 [Kiritimatiellae bacterium]|nr:hypothetical protein [Kiritimatiellia bacterium]